MDEGPSPDEGPRLDEEPRLSRRHASAGDRVK